MFVFGAQPSRSVHTWKHHAKAASHQRNYDSSLRDATYAQCEHDLPELQSSAAAQSARVHARLAAGGHSYDVLIACPPDKVDSCKALLAGLQRVCTPRYVTTLEAAVAALDSNAPEGMLIFDGLPAESTVMARRMQLSTASAALITSCALAAVPMCVLSRDGGHYVSGYGDASQDEVSGVCEEVGAQVLADTSPESVCKKGLVHLAYLMDLQREDRLRWGMIEQESSPEFFSLGMLSNQFQRAAVSSDMSQFKRSPEIEDIYRRFGFD